MVLGSPVGLGQEQPAPYKTTDGQPAIKHPKASLRTPAMDTYLALSWHTDGCAVLVTGGAVNNLLSLPHIEAIAHCLAVQLTLAIALYYQKQEREKMSLLQTISTFTSPIVFIVINIKFIILTKVDTTMGFRIQYSQSLYNQHDCLISQHSHHLKKISMPAGHHWLSHSLFPDPGKHQSTSCLHGFVYSGYFISTHLLIVQKNPKWSSLL